MSSVEIKFERAKEAINDLFGDQSVPQGVTKEKLEELRDGIDELIDLLSSDKGEG